MQNQLRDYLSLARSFEHGDWSAIKRHSAKLALDQRMLHSIYNEAIKWAGAMTRSIRQP